MSVTGTVKNGVVVLPSDVHLMEGQQVEIMPAPTSPEDGLLREIAQTIPVARDLPDDLAINLDYYLHGHQRKQQPRRGRWFPGDTPEPGLSEQQVAEDSRLLLSLAAETRNLPPDLSTNHDHYLHGLPKR